MSTTDGIRPVEAWPALSEEQRRRVRNTLDAHLKSLRIAAKRNLGSVERAYVEAGIEAFETALAVLEAER